MERNGRTQASLYGSDGRRKYLTPVERLRFIEAALQHPRDDVGTLALVIAYTGCRISEALALCTANVECAEAFIAFRSLKKRGKIVFREVPIPKALADRLRAIHHFDTAAPDTRLWRWSRGQAWWLMRELMREAGISPGPHATSKGLRHGFGINALRNGVPINLVKRWLGHASLATTEIYLDAIGAEEREFAERMWTIHP